MIYFKGRKCLLINDIFDMYFIFNGKLSYFFIFIIDLVLEVIFFIFIQKLFMEYEYGGRFYCIIKEYNIL